MNNLKYNKNKIKVFHIGNILNKKNLNINNSQKKIIESYYTKNNNKSDFFTKKNINLETSTISNKNDNLSLFSFLNYNTNCCEEKLINKSLRTTKETESNIIINNKNQNYFYNNNNITYILDNKNKNIIKVKQKTKHEKKINNNNNINISDELDKFKNRIDNIFKIIDNFEKNFLNSSKPKKIKEEFEKIIKNKKCYNVNIKTKNYNKNSESRKYSRSIKNLKININKENNKHIIKKNFFSSANNINDINTKNMNSLTRRIKYSLLLSGNSNKKCKTKRILKNKKEKNNNILNTQYFLQKSIELYEKNPKTNKKNIFINPNLNKTPRIKNFKGKFK